MAQLSDNNLPQVGLRFKSSDDAWLFWVAYGGRIGFDVRKRYTNLSKYDGKVTSCRFVCSNEGHRRKGLTESVKKCFRAETRTDCKARITLTLDREKEDYEITEVVLEHNHLLQLPHTCHLMASQRKISELQAFEIETADDSGIRPKGAHELACRQVGGALNLGYTCRDRKNYLQSKRQRELAECYIRNVYSLGVRSTQLSESFNNALKNHLKSDFDIVQFLKHFERTVQEKRRKEVDREFDSRKKQPRRKMCTPMLIQASDVYTPIIFEAFQSEYERSMAARARVLDGDNRYAISTVSLHDNSRFEEERIVIGDPLNSTVSCSCGMFSRTGILCAHGLKVLDLMNIKILPAHYILKRWTREARNGTIQDRQGINVIENPKREAQLRHKFLSHKFHSLADRAAGSLECCVMLDNALDSLSAQLEEKLNLSTSATNDPCKDQENIDPNVQEIDALLSSAQLKKKEVLSKSSKRQQTWLDKLCRRGKRKANKSAVPTKKETKKQKKNDNGQHAQVEGENGGSSTGGNVELQEYNSVASFTQLLTAPLCVDLDQDLF